MRLDVRDLLATVLVAAIGILYVGYLGHGRMPFAHDTRGMTAMGLALGVTAFVVVRNGDKYDRVGQLETGLAVVALAFGMGAMVLAEGTVAENLLAAYVVVLLAVWGLELLDHAGLVPGHAPPKEMTRT